MTITELLKTVDRLVEKQRGKHLNDLEKVVIKGLWDGKTYGKIAEECGYHQNHVGDVSRQLFKILSQELEQDINKNNFCWTIERVVTSRQFNVVGLFNSNITWCHPHVSDDLSSLNSSQPHEDIKANYHDLHLAPKIINFCDRTQELKTLSNWIFNQNIPLISVLGLPGIGKTSLVKQFIDLNMDKFDAVFWKSLKIQPGLDHNITSILNKMGYVNPLTESETPLCQLLNSSILRYKKCLIILDDLEEIFNPGVFAGQYKTEHKDYQELFKRIAEISHQSHFILLSQEPCQDMLDLNDELGTVKYLELKGLTSVKFLSDRGLADKQQWSKLIHLYEGHPGYLKDVAQLIKDIFSGKVSDFLAENEIIITGEIASQLGDIWQRLSGIETQILIQLSQADRPLSRNELKQELSLSLMDLINGLQSLTRRHLIQKIEREPMLFCLSQVIREYVKSCYGDREIAR